MQTDSNSAIKHDDATSALDSLLLPPLPPPLLLPLLPFACPPRRCAVQVCLSVRDKLAHVKNGKYIVVAGITPTPLGEGKRCAARAVLWSCGGAQGSRRRRTTPARLAAPAAVPLS